MKKEKLLIVIDMQNDFIRGSLANEDAVKMLPKVKKKIEEWDGMIIYTKDIHEKDYLGTLEGKKLPVPHCIRGTEGALISSAIPFTPRTDGIFLKNVYEKNGFGSVDLMNDVAGLYKAGGLKEAQIIGLCTDICVITNALMLKGAIPNLQITVDSSSTEAITPESKIHALKTMKMCQIDII